VIASRNIRDKFTNTHSIEKARTTKSKLTRSTQMHEKERYQDNWSSTNINQNMDIPNNQTKDKN